MEIETFFQEANANNLKNLTPQVYDRQVKFVDPLTEIEGLENLTSYYQKMYEGAESVNFSFNEHIIQGDTHMLTWIMTVTAKSLNGGKPFTVEGVSHLRYKNNLVVYHRDYFDLSEMIYEKLPVVGGLFAWLKTRAAH